ncbi:MAG TPA: hypothetical protein VGH03_09080, partial [Caulobacteraceae bacterium]
MGTGGEEHHEEAQTEGPLAGHRRQGPRRQPHYRVDAHRLGFGTLHPIFTCRQPGFLRDGAQANACGKLISATRSTLGLTGTLIGGYANHLFPLLMRMSAGP